MAAIFGERRRLRGREKIDIFEPATKRYTDPRLIAARSFRRTEDMLEAHHQFDVAPSEQARAEIVEWLNEVYEARGAGQLIGIFSRCYLGAPYVDHRLDLLGNILEHYRPNDPLPAGLDAARALISSGQYSHIEVYSDGMILPIRRDGTAAV